ncbi:hypothetical protein ES288_D05G199300v1 [Gossypium darwinii]|uniref:Arginyl-tRNA synthetase catalytic core domain-containing protein n=1 Tax=Gossypium darwinii TaxID=34276 RepID=A0A5D2CI42_GOSDA|nr:hypothetical protein ES288_D05G199300v1 [Gossypium darwinii]
MSQASDLLGFSFARSISKFLWWISLGVAHVYPIDVFQRLHKPLPCSLKAIVAAKRAGWLPQGDNYPKASHVGFGLVLGEDGKRFRTRNTEVVRLVDLLDEAKNRSKAALIEHGKGEEWTEEEIESTADAVGYGAVKKQFARSLKSQRFPHLFFLVINFDFLDAAMPFIHFCEILKL